MNTSVVKMLINEDTQLLNSTIRRSIYLHIYPMEPLFTEAVVVSKFGHIHEPMELIYDKFSIVIPGECIIRVDLP